MDAADLCLVEGKEQWLFRSMWANVGIHSSSCYPLESTDPYRAIESKKKRPLKHLQRCKTILYGPKAIKSELKNLLSGF